MFVPMQPQRIRENRVRYPQLNLPRDLATGIQSPEEFSDTCRHRVRWSTWDLSGVSRISCCRSPVEAGRPCISVSSVQRNVWSMIASCTHAIPGGRRNALRPLLTPSKMVLAIGLFWCYTLSLSYGLQTFGETSI